MEFSSHIGPNTGGTVGLQPEAINYPITCTDASNAGSTISYTPTHCATNYLHPYTNANTYTNSNGKTHADSNANITA